MLRTYLERITETGQHEYHCPECSVVVRAHRKMSLPYWHGCTGPARGPCGNHGPDDEFRLQDCDTCPSTRRTRIKVFECSVLTECTTETRVRGVKGCCKGCPEWRDACSTPPT